MQFVPISEETIVNSAHISNPTGPGIIKHTKGYIVYWLGFINNSPKVMMRAFGNKADPQTDPVILADLEGEDVYGFPSIVLTLDNILVAAWNKKPNGSSVPEVNVAKFDLQGRAISRPVVITKPDGKLHVWPYLLALPSGEFCVVYVSAFPGIASVEPDVCGLILTKDLTPKTSAFPLSELASGRQDYPKAYNFGTDIIALWRSLMKPGGDGVHGLWGQILDRSGIRIAGQFLLSRSDELTAHSAYQFDAAELKDGFIAAWSEHFLKPDRTPVFRIWSRRYDNRGKPLGEGQQIGEKNEPGLLHRNPCVAVSSQMTLVLWDYYSLRDGVRDIYGRVFTSTLEPLGAESAVCTPFAGSRIMPVAEFLEPNVVALCWLSTSSRDEGPHEITTRTFRLSRN